MTADAQTYADQAIKRGSQSFAAASRLFDESMRRDVAKLYAWCRHCDDVVDGQELGHGMTEPPSPIAERLEKLDVETRRAVSGEAVEHPAFVCLQEVIQKHGLPTRLPLDHLHGFRMDAEGRRFETVTDLLEYCYGVAGVVGIMMAHIMGARQTATLHRACDLGLAFQLTNIARDVIDDAGVGRVYLPLDWLRDAGIAPDQLALPVHREAVAKLADRLVESAEPYYASARMGIAALPFRAACAVDAARGVYRAIGRKVVARGPEAWDKRISTGRSEKLRFLLGGVAGAIRSRIGTERERPASLWTRPL